jgi:serine/threonine protein kinase
MPNVLLPHGVEVRYVLAERLGRGGVAETWRARREGLVTQEVCVKRPILPFLAEQRRAFLEEARLLARIRHPNVVSLIDAAEDERGVPFLVLELVEGTDLRRLIRAAEELERGFAPALIAAVGAVVCRALAAAERALPPGVVHRDVTPHNMLVSVDGELKLADFGIARAFDRARWTGVGLVKGKTAYVSPEQIRGEELDIRSDLFSLGVVLYELLAGRRPFGGEGRFETLRAIQAGERVPLERLAPCAPPQLVSAIERLLDPRREGRPGSADAAGRLLEDHADVRMARSELAARVRALRQPGVVKARERLPSRTRRVISTP